MSPIYGAECYNGISSSSGGSSSGSGYTAEGVLFIGQSGDNFQCGIRLPALHCTNNGFLSWAGWFKHADWDNPDTGLQTGFPYLFVVDPNGDYIPDFHKNGSTQWTAEWGNGTHDTESFIDTSITSPPNRLISGQWLHLMSTIDTNQPAGHKNGRIFITGVDATMLTGDTSVPFNLAMDGKEFWLGDDGFGDGAYIECADFSFWPGVSFLSGGTIPQEIIDRFIDEDGRPVDPNQTIHEFGFAPAVMCTGGVSGFLANHNGTNGALEVPSGWDSPLAAPTSP